jgi:hypothetical protein
MIGSLPFPYIVSCGIVALLVGGPGLILAYFLEHGDLGQAVRTVLGPEVPAWRSAPLVVLSVAFYAYVFWNVRYSRLHVLIHAPQIIPLLPDEDAGFRRIFARIGNRISVLVLAVALIGFFAILLFDVPTIAIGPATLVIVGLNLIFASILEAQVVWNYVSTLDGLRRLGKENLRLKPSTEDPMRGLRPLGSLSLRATSLYFGALGLVIPQTLLNPTPVRPAYLVFLVSLLFLGAGLFVLPLRSIHRTMLAAKERELESVRQEARDVYTAPTGPAGNPEATLTEVRDWIARTHGILSHEANARRVSELPTWPYETGAMDRILAITVTGVVAVVGRALVDVLLLR